MVVGDSQVPSRTKKGHGQWKLQSTFMPKFLCQIAFWNYICIDIFRYLCMTNFTMQSDLGFPQRFWSDLSFAATLRCPRLYNRRLYYMLATNERSVFPPMSSLVLRFKVAGILIYSVAIRYMQLYDTIQPRVSAEMFIGSCSSCRHD